MNNVHPDAIPVNRATFRHFVHPKNVNQTRISNWDRDHGYLYEWHLVENRQVLGWTYSGKGWGDEGEDGKRYWLHPSLRHEIEAFIESETLGNIFGVDIGISLFIFRSPRQRWGRVSSAVKRR